MKHAIFASILVSVLPILAGADEANSITAERDKPGAYRAVGPLDASQLQAIQHVSRSVLTAKRGYKGNAEQAALRDEIKGLSAVIDTALAPQRGSKVVLLDTAASSVSANVEKPRVGEDNHYGEVRARLATVRERRQKIEKRTRRADSDPDKPQTENLAAKVAELERETDAALNAQGGERITRLRGLHERLQAKGLQQTMDKRFEKPANAPEDAASRNGSGLPNRITPTISTLVRHR